MSMGIGMVYRILELENEATGSKLTTLSNEHILPSIY